MTDLSMGCEDRRGVDMAKKVLQKKVLSEQIREQLMESILSGDYKPGEKLVENTLAKEFGVSQAPVREALKSLETLGLVAVEPYKGTTVKKFGRESMHEYFVVRSALEGLAGRLAAENITEEELEELEKLLADMIEAAEQKDFERRSEINQVFHNTIIEASHNSLLVSVCKNVRLGSWSRITSKYTNMESKIMASRHQEMVTFLRNRDADGIEKALHRHIQESFDSFNRSFYADECEDEEETR
jgi:DNA-binding GntR family transcriptional regulator